jgi:hypothetical protein
MTAVVALSVAGLASGLAGCSSSTGAASTTSTTSSSTPTSTAGPGTTTTTIPASVNKLYQTMLSRASRAGSVHYVAVSDSSSPSGTTHLEFVTDAAKSSGSQRGTWSGGGHSGSFTVIVAGSTIYLQADASSYVTFFDALSASKAVKYAGKWVVIPKTEKLASSLDTITMSSVATNLQFLPATEQSLGASILISGQPLPTGAIPAGAKTAASTTVSTTTFLPAQQRFTASLGGESEQSSVIFSEWGSATPMPAPTGAIPWSTVVG